MPLDLTHIDTELTLAMNGSISVFMDNLAYVATNSWVWSPLIFVLLYVIVKSNKAYETLSILGAIAMMLLLSNLLNSFGIKPWVGRLRPCQDPVIVDLIQVVRGYREVNFSFYSSHACNSFCLAMFLSLLFRRLWLTTTTFLLAAFVSYTRIYLGQHFFGDVVVGSVVGMLWGGIAYFAYRRLAFNLAGKRLISEQFTSTGYLVADTDMLSSIILLNIICVIIIALSLGI